MVILQKIKQKEIKGINISFNYIYNDKDNFLENLEDNSTQNKARVLRLLEDIKLQYDTNKIVLYKDYFREVED